MYGAYFLSLAAVKKFTTFGYKQVALGAACTVMLMPIYSTYNYAHRWYLGKKTWEAEKFLCKKV